MISLCSIEATVHSPALPDTEDYFYEVHSFSLVHPSVPHECMVPEYENRAAMFAAVVVLALDTNGIYR